MAEFTTLSGLPAPDVEITDDIRNIPIVPDDTSKVCYIADLNLFSGSSDIFRTNVGGYFFSTVKLTGDATLSFSPFVSTLDSLEDSYRSLNPYIESVRSVPLAADSEVASEKDKIVPNYKFVVTVDGKPDKIVNDEFWRVLWMGGTFNEINYSSIINMATYDDFYTSYKNPYGAITKQYLTNPEQVTNYINITYDYNSYYSNYQIYAQGIESERLLPNIYLNTWAHLYTTGSGDYPSNMYNFISYDEQIGSPQSFFDNPDNVKIYLEQSASTLSMSDQTKEWADRKFQNIFFNEGSFQGVYPEVWAELNFGAAADSSEDERIQAQTGSYPYYTKIEFPAMTPGYLNDLISRAGFSSRMLRLLKEVFTNEAVAAGVPTGTTGFEKNTTFLTSSVELQADTHISENTSIELRNVDFFDLMLHSYRTIVNRSDNFIIMDTKNIETESTYDTKGAYRHLNTSNTLELMNSVLEAIQSADGVEDITSLLNVKRDSSDVKSGELADDNVFTPDTKYTEVIAYRIEKLRGNVDGASTAPSTVQNFWFFNAKELTEDHDKLRYFDAQVKYGEQYTYNVYEYRAIQGIKYKYTDLQLSRIIGLPNTEQVDLEADSAYEPTYYCIEYYDPNTNAAANDLLDSSGYDWDSSDPISSLASPAQRIATFLVTTEPRIKIFEVPIMTKSTAVMDHPPNKLNIFPNYTTGRTNTIMFELYYESFNSQTFPKIITGLDAVAKPVYLSSNELLETSTLPHETVSRHENIQVFRMDSKPDSIADFDGHLIDTVNLRMDNPISTYNGTVFYDRIPSNRKFYYMFRVINENGVPGYVHEIIEAEYINDGGYTYALFNTLYEQDLGQIVFKGTAKKTKKLFQLSPTAQQLVLNTDGADFNGTAAEALENGTVQIGTAEDLIWNKTFKVRLTSRKTGKKLDLNVTYKQNNDILGS